MKLRFAVLALLAIASAGLLLSKAPSLLTVTHDAIFPAPIDEPGEGANFGERRRAWIEYLHRAAPDVDWRRQDADFRAARFAQHEALRAQQLKAGASAGDLRKVSSAAISGNWVERGSNNQAGRVMAANYDAAGNRLTVLSAGGNVWRASRALLDWRSPNDGASFSSSSLERLGGGLGERLLIASDSPRGVFRSDNGGLSWTANAGTTLANPWYTMDLVSRDPTLAEVYLLRVHYDFTATDWKPHLYSSNDRGQSFTARQFVGKRDQVALFSPPYGSSEVFLLDGAQLSTISPGAHTLVPLATLPLGFTLASEDDIALSGGVSGGQVFLYAFYSRPSSNKTEVLRSVDGGRTWIAVSPVPTKFFKLNSAESSGNDPLRAYVGGVNLFRTADGGISWIMVNNWTEYYPNPAIKLHADITNIDVSLDNAGQERVYISTDGGLYESLDHTQTVQNLNLNGMNVSQYYGTYTQRTPPFAVLAGAQDQGYQKALAPTGAIEPYVQTISGDYGHLESADGGKNLWMVYPGFVMLDTRTSMTGQSGLKLWRFEENNFTGWFFLPPLAVDPLNPLRILLAGGNLSGSGQRLINLTSDGVNFTHAEIPFDFNSKVTAVAFSTDGNSRYAINDEAQFFRQMGAGAWSRTSTGMPNNHYFFGNRILVDPVTPGKIYVAGAGYSNPGVYVSTNNGDSFTSLSTGLPSTLVFDLALSSNGEHLFAATELGPYYFDSATNTWQDISGLGAPNQAYWDVDFVDAQGIARFSTYGRGIWDFVLPRSAGLQFISVAKLGNGSGLVTSSVAGLNCGAACNASFPVGTQLTLLANPAAGTRFVAWVGCDANNGAQCNVLMSGARHVSAVFENRAEPLAVVNLPATTGVACAAFYSIKTFGNPGILPGVTATEITLQGNDRRLVGGLIMKGNVLRSGAFAGVTVPATPGQPVLLAPVAFWLPPDMGAATLEVITGNQTLANIRLPARSGAQVIPPIAIGDRGGYFSIRITPASQAQLGNRPFAIELGVKFNDGTSAYFDSGTVVGGVIDSNNPTEVSFCMSQGQNVQIRTLGFPTYADGVTGQYFTVRNPQDVVVFDSRD